MNRSLSAVGVLLLSAFAMVAVPLPGFGRAGAAPLGTVRLSQASGTIDATPIFARATASRPCPAGYGRNALVRAGRAGRTRTSPGRCPPAGTTGLP